MVGYNITGTFLHLCTPVRKNLATKKQKKVYPPHTLAVFPFRIHTRLLLHAVLILSKQFRETAVSPERQTGEADTHTHTLPHTIRNLGPSVESDSRNLQRVHSGMRLDVFSLLQAHVVSLVNRLARTVLLKNTHTHTQERERDRQRRAMTFSCLPLPSPLHASYSLVVTSQSNTEKHRPCQGETRMRSVRPEQGGVPCPDSRCLRARCRTTSWGSAAGRTWRETRTTVTLTCTACTRPSSRWSSR